MVRLLYMVSILVLAACAKPKATVFLDKSLMQEEVVKFCFTGDMGKDTPHQQAIADALNRDECHRIFFLGDLVYPKGVTSLQSEEFEKKFLNYYEPLLMEHPDLYISLILGNHDHKGKPDAWKNISKINDRFFFPGYFYMIDYGGLCIVGLDTSFYYYLNSVSEITEQTMWIQNLQSRLKDCDVKVAMTHHPFKGTGYDNEDDWEGAKGALKTFLDTYVIGVFDIHIAGHVHIVQKDGKDEGTHMLISGAGGETRDGNRAGYIVLTWVPSNPKRIGYSIRYVETQTNVVDDDVQKQEAEVETEAEHIIPKRRVEDSLWGTMWKQVKGLF